jgi:prevent-host-death family protein
MIAMYNAELPDNLGDFGELLRRVLSGEEVILSQAGTPVARIIPFSHRPLARIPGLDRGKVVIAPDFNSPLPEDILKDFLNPLDIQNESIT